jgi:hypothetical protein
MKSSKWVLFVAGLLLVGVLVISLGGVTRAASIVGSKHDMSTTGGSAAFGAAGQTQVCIYCHTPHSAKTGVDDLAPLWNHANTVAIFTTYGTTAQGTTAGAVGGTSKACLSCHDGTVAVDSFGSATGTHLIGAGATLIGTDLTNDHPISIEYAKAGVTGLAAAVGGKVGTLPLFSNNVECASCHSVHDNGHTKFQRVSNAQSALCITCHMK